MSNPKKSLGSKEHNHVRGTTSYFNIETIAKCTRERIEKETLTDKEKEKHEKMMKRLRREYRKIAIELYYPKDILRKIENAQTENELDRIMKSARNNL